MGKKIVKLGPVQKYLGINKSQLSPKQAELYTGRINNANHLGTKNLVFGFFLGIVAGYGLFSWFGK